MGIVIGSNLRMLRRRSKHTLEEVAEIIGVSRQAVAKWEAGETYPDLGNCVKLSTLYKVSLDAMVKEPVRTLSQESNPAAEDRYFFGVVKIGASGDIHLPEKALELLEAETGDRLLLLG